MATPQCNEYSCQRRSTPSTQISYSFPSWFLRRQLSLSVLFTPLDGPIISLKFPRLVSPSSKMFDYALLGNIAGMKFLFKEGLASPYDVRFDCGVSALQVSSFDGFIGQRVSLLVHKRGPSFRSGFGRASIFKSCGLSLSSTQLTTAKSKCANFFCQSRLILSWKTNHRRKLRRIFDDLHSSSVEAQWTRPGHRF